MENKEEEHQHVIFNKTLGYSDSVRPETLERKFQSETLLRPVVNESSSALKHKSVVIKISNWDNKNKTNTLINSNDSIETATTERNNSLDTIKYEYINFHKNFRNRTNKEGKKSSISDIDVTQIDLKNLVNQEDEVKKDFYGLQKSIDHQSFDDTKSVEPTYNVISLIQSLVVNKFTKKTNTDQGINSTLNNNKISVSKIPEVGEKFKNKIEYKDQVKSTVEQIKLFLRVWMGLENSVDDGSPVDNNEIVHDNICVANPDVQNFMQNFHNIWNSTNRHSIDESVTQLRQYFKGNATVNQVTAYFKTGQSSLPDVELDNINQEHDFFDDSFNINKKRIENSNNNNTDNNLTATILNEKEVIEKNYKTKEVFKNKFNLPDSLKEIINTSINKNDKINCLKKEVVSAQLPNIVFSFDDDNDKKPYKQIPDSIKSPCSIKKPIKINTVCRDENLIKKSLIYNNSKYSVKTKLKLENEENSGLEKKQIISEIKNENELINFAKVKQNCIANLDSKAFLDQTNKTGDKHKRENNILNVVNSHVSDLSNISAFKSVHEEWGRTNREACDKNSLNAINDFLNGTSNLKTLNVVLSKNKINNQNLKINVNKSSAKNPCSNKYMPLCQNQDSTIRKDIMRSYIRQKVQLPEYTTDFQPEHIRYRDKQILQSNRTENQCISSKHNEKKTNNNCTKSKTKIAICKMKNIQPMEDLKTDDFHKRLEKKFHKQY